MRRHVLQLLVVTACLVVTAACSTSGSSFDVGLQRVALDLAFKDEALAEEGRGPTPAIEVAPERALSPIPVESQAELTLAIPRLAAGDIEPEPLPIVFHTDCPTASPDAIPPATVTTDITTLVKPGRYVHREEGEFALTGPFTFKGGLPPFSIRDYQNPKALPQEPDWTLAGEPVPVPVQVPHPDHYEWEVVQPLGGKDYVKRLFEATDEDLLLKTLTYKVGDQVVEFKPQPPIIMMKLAGEGGEGATWTSAGTDPDTRTSMVVQGEILRRELVDACGTVYETWKVQSTERIASIGGGVPFTSTTDDAVPDPQAESPGLPNFYWVATQYGGQFLKEETHTTTQIAAVGISIDGLSTVTSLDPLPLPREPR